MKKFFEYTQQDLKPLESFKIHDELNPDIWDKNGKKQETLKKDICADLLEIAEDYIKTVDFDIKVTDIVLVGSACNYNWSKYSDFDLHILTDYSKINKDVDFVKAYFDLHKKGWNSGYPITIKGYDVELYIQDINDPEFYSMGIYSIKNDKWIEFPDKLDIDIDLDNIENKATDIMESVDLIEDMLSKTKAKDVDALNNIKDKIDIIWKKIKKYRKEGLETKDSEFSVGNLIFKFLRRNDFIEKKFLIRKNIILKKYEE